MSPAAKIFGKFSDSKFALTRIKPSSVVPRSEDFSHAGPTAPVAHKKMSAVIDRPSFVETVFLSKLDTKKSCTRVIWFFLSSFSQTWRVLPDCSDKMLFPLETRK